MSNNGNSGYFLSIFHEDFQHICIEILGFKDCFLRTEPRTLFLSELLFMSEFCLVKNKKILIFIIYF